MELDPFLNNFNGRKTIIETFALRLARVDQHILSTKNFNLLLQVIKLILEGTPLLNEIL